MAQYYENVHLPEVRNYVNKLAANPEDEDARLTVANELPVLARAARIDGPKDGESPSAFLDRAAAALHQRAHNFTAYLEKVREETADKYGSDYLLDKKKANHNSAIEDLVMGSGTRAMFRHQDHRIYPLVGQVYLEPESAFGRAVFYSHAKKIGGMVVSTYKFNLLVIGFFALLTIIAIFAEFPKSIMKK